jgi:hypothetical protein
MRHIIYNKYTILLYWKYMTRLQIGSELNSYVFLQKEKSSRDNLSAPAGYSKWSVTASVWYESQKPSNDQLQHAYNPSIFKAYNNNVVKSWQADSSCCTCSDDKTRTWTRIFRRNSYINHFHKREKMATEPELKAAYYKSSCTYLENELGPAATWSAD